MGHTIHQGSLLGQKECECYAERGLCLGGDKNAVPESPGRPATVALGELPATNLFEN